MDKQKSDSNEGNIHLFEREKFQPEQKVLDLNQPPNKYTKLTRKRRIQGNYYLIIMIKYLVFGHSHIDQRHKYINYCVSEMKPK